MELQELQPGPELDALIAEKVMKQKFWTNKRGGYTFVCGLLSDGREPWFGVKKP